MPGDDFVTKMEEGRVRVPRRMKWWLDHARLSCAYTGYKGNFKSGDVGRKILKEQSTACAAEWDELLRLPGGAMAEHAGLEHALADAAMMPHFDRENLITISQFMLENVEKHVAAAAKIQDFPMHTWRNLFLDHVRIFTEIVRWQLMRDLRKLSVCQERWRSNALALSSLSAEWF